MYTPFVQAPWPFLTAVARTHGGTRSRRRIAAPGARAPGSGTGGGRNPDLRSVSRAIDRDAALHGHPARRLCRAGAAARRLRPLRRDGVFRRAAQPRDRHPHGARRAVRPTFDRSSSARRCGSARRGWSLGIAGALAVTRVLDSLLFGVTRQRSADLRRRVGGAHHRSPARRVSPGPARDARRSYRGTQS